MDMENVIVGPPGYGSPDPRTVAGRLVTLDEHPDAENIAEDYGSDVTPEQVDLATPDGVFEKSDTAGESGDDGLSSKKKDELVDMARDMEIEGFSTMSKGELVSAISAAQADDDADDEN